MVMMTMVVIPVFAALCTQWKGYIDRLAHVPCSRCTKRWKPVKQGLSD